MIRKKEGRGNGTKIKGRRERKEEHLDPTSNLGSLEKYLIIDIYIIKLFRHLQAVELWRETKDKSTLINNYISPPPVKNGEKPSFKAEEAKAFICGRKIENSSELNLNKIDGDKYHRKLYNI